MHHIYPKREDDGVVYHQRPFTRPFQGLHRRNASARHLRKLVWALLTIRCNYPHRASLTLQAKLEERLRLRHLQLLVHSQGGYKPSKPLPFIKRSAREQGPESEGGCYTVQGSTI